MPSLYPSLVACGLTLTLCMLSSGDVAVLQPFRLSTMAVSLTCFTYLAALFVHFTNPNSQLYLYHLVVCCLAYIVYRHRWQPVLLLQMALVGAAVSLCTIRVLELYPFPTWHGVPVLCLLFGLWLVAATCFSDREQALGTLCAILLIPCLEVSGHPQWLLHQFTSTSVTRLYESFFPDLFWITMCALTSVHALSGIAARVRARLG